MNKLIIPLLGATVLLGGCHPAAVRTSVEVPVGVVEHRHLHEDVVVVERHEYEGDTHYHHPSYSYPSHRVVVVNPPPVVEQTHVTLQYYGGDYVRHDRGRHLPPPPAQPVVVHDHDGRGPMPQPGNGHRPYGNPPRPVPEVHGHNSRGPVLHSDNGRRPRGEAPRSPQPPVVTWSRGHDGHEPSPRDNDHASRAAPSPQGEHGQQRSRGDSPTHPSPGRSRGEQVAEARHNKPEPAKGGDKHHREKKAEREEWREENDKGHRR